MPMGLPLSLTVSVEDFSCGRRRRWNGLGITHVSRHRWQPPTCLVQPGSHPAAIENAPPGTRVAPFELSAIPMFNADSEAEGDPPQWQTSSERSRPPDALLIATPKQNHCVPGVLKNAIDWASRPARRLVLTGK